MIESDEVKNYKILDDIHFNEESEVNSKKGVREIFENEISEPEIMLFCKGDSQSTELLQKFSYLSKCNQYELMINLLQHLEIEDKSDPEKKSRFIKAFYMVK